MNAGKVAVRFGLMMAFVWVAASAWAGGTSELRKQVEYIVARGWNPGIEHTEPENASSNYWYMWKLPMFGETDIDAIFQEVEQCKKANPGNHVRLIGYDNFRQTQGTAMVVHRAEIKV